MTERGSGGRERRRDEADLRPDDPADSVDSGETIADGGAAGPADGHRRRRPADDDLAAELAGDLDDGPETVLYEPGESPDPGGGAPPTESFDAPRRDDDRDDEDEDEDEDSRATIAGGFAATALPRTDGGATVAPQDDGATVFDPGLTERLKDRKLTHEDPAAGTRRDGPGRTRTPGGTGARDASATARDMAAAQASSTGTPRGRAGPMRLAEGALLAERYELVRRLGKGGMGEVWKARHLLLEGNRAIKVIKASISKDKAFRARFVNEGQTMMRIKHPGVVEVTDLDEMRPSGELFMVMEHLEGRTLYDAIRDGDHPLCDDLRETVRIYKEIADGMQRIHDERIVHKDLKSDNVLLVKGEDGLEHPKVIDFGLAKRLEDDEDTTVGEGGAAISGTYEPDLRTTLSGTLAYMAPEQFKQQPSSFRSDIFALGVMLYEAFLRGKYPLPRGGLAHYLKLHAEGKVPARLADDRPDLDRTIARIADRCMAPAMEDRPESFRDVAHDLQWWLDAPLRREKRKRRMMLIGAFVFMAAIAVVGYFLGDTVPTLSDVAAQSGSDALDRSGSARRVYLRDDHLRELAFTAFLAGVPKEPRLSVDGEVVEARIERRKVNGRDALIAHADLSHLADGSHDIGFRAATNGEDTVLPAVVDRSPPPIEDVRVRGADSGVTNDDAPVVFVDVGEDTVASVRAFMRDSDQTLGGDLVRDDDRRAWVVRGTAETDGPVRFEVVATDLAGNVSRREFSYVRDTVDPELELHDLVEGKLQARESTGAVLRVTADESGSFAVTFGGGTPAKKTLEAAGEASFDVPVIPQNGFDARVEFTDVAGNRTERVVPAKREPDVVTVATTDGKDTLVTDASEDVQFRVTRTYPLAAAALKIQAQRLEDPSGVGAAPLTDIDAGIGTGTERSVPVDLLKSVLNKMGDGFFRVVAAGQDPAGMRSLLITVDRTEPVITGVRVRDAQGREVAPGAWSQSQIVTVDVEADDLLVTDVRLTGDGSVKRLFQDPSPGAGTYPFEVTLTNQGRNAFTVNVEDTAGNTVERPLTVNADWESPTLTLSAPEPGGLFNDTAPVRIAGACSEARYTLVVTSTGGEDLQDSAHEAADFSVQHTFDVGTPTITVVAVDRSGRRSAPRSVPIRVEKLRTELPPEIDWTEGVTVKMEKVSPGDVLIGDRLQPVGRVFVDKTEVTNAQYRTFLAASAGRTEWDHPEQPAGWDHTPAAETWGDPSWNADDLPVVNVAFWDAWAFASWSGRRLPTEAEWVRAAAKVEGEGDLLRWPTGNEPEAGLLLVTQETVGDSAQPVSAVTGDDVSPIGCLHMGGNVSEWVEAAAEEDDGAPIAAVRGGSWFFTRVAASVFTPAMKDYGRELRKPTIGFRCAQDEDKVKP